MKQLRLGDKLRLPLDAVTRTTAICGQRGTGKTSTAVVTAEEALAAGAQVAVIDPTGAWYGLRSSADGNGPGLEVVVFGGHHGDVPLEAEAGAFLARLVIDEGINVVLDLELMTKGKQVQFVAEFAETLYHSNRRALTLIIDEAHRFAPQQLRDPGGFGARCLGAVTDVVTLGRRKGLGAVLISQRPAKINKDVFEQAEIMVAHRLMGPNDRKAIAGWLDEAIGSVNVELGTLSSLDRGEAIVWAPDLDLMGRYAIRAKRTFDSSATPEIGAKVAEPKGRADVDLAAIEQAMAATIERAKADDPAELRKRIRDLERQLRAQPTEQVEVEVERMPAFVASRIVDLQGLITPLAKQATTVADEVARLRADVENSTAAKTSAPRPPSPPARSLAGPARPPVRRTEGAQASENGRPGAQEPSDLTGPQQRVLDAVAWLEQVGFEQPTKLQVGFIAGYRVGKRVGGTFGNILGQLRGADLIGYPSQGQVELTPAGRAIATPPAIEMTTEGLQSAVFARLAEPERRVLAGILDDYPHAISKQEAGERAGYQVGDRVGGTFGNILGRLRSLGLVDYPEPGQVAALPVLFLDAVAA